MSIYCSLIIQDLNKPFVQNSTRSIVFIREINTSVSNHYVCVKNSVYPNGIDYNLAMLENIYCKFIGERKIGFEFKKPRHALLIVADDKKMIYMFYRQLKDIINGKNIIIGSRRHISDVINRFDPISLDFIPVNRFDTHILNMGILSKLVLENCNLPKMPIQVGYLPIQYLSISNSKLATSLYDQGVFWNWTSIITICDTLQTLKMDSVGLKSLPFEIFFLKNLQTLSVSKNNLVIKYIYY